MRNPDRISLILKELEYIWRECPDLRLGQLIMNLYHIKDIYYIEDEPLIKALKAHYFKHD